MRPLPSCPARGSTFRPTISVALREPLEQSPRALEVFAQQRGSTIGVARQRRVLNGAVLLHIVDQIIGVVKLGGEEKSRITFPASEHDVTKLKQHRRAAGARRKSR